MNRSTGKVSKLEEKNSSKGKKKTTEEEEDRLSSLPDEIIQRVLSFVDAVSAVQTSVLSKRWKNLWTSLSVLNFDSSSFDDPFLFQCFIDNFMSHRDASSNVYAIKFVCNDELDDGYIVDSIIDHVSLTTPISASIQVLSIVAECVLEKLPQLSVCQSLTALTLADIATEIRAFDFVSLEKLFLFDCRFECGLEEELDLFKGCVNLKSLFLHDCQFYGKIGEFKIFAPHLVDLSVSRMRVDEVFASKCVIELFTPKLKTFSYCDSELYDFSIKGKLSFVEKLDIVMDCLTADDTFSLRLIELFEVMGSAKFVSLSLDIIEVLSMFPDLLNGRSSPFTRVQSFELNMERRTSSYVLPTNVMAYLFGGSPPGFGSVGWEGALSKNQFD